MFNPLRSCFERILLRTTKKLKELLTPMTWMCAVGGAISCVGIHLLGEPKKTELITKNKKIKREPNETWAIFTERTNTHTRLMLAIDTKFIF